MQEQQREGRHIGQPERERGRGPDHAGRVARVGAGPPAVVEQDLLVAQQREGGGGHADGQSGGKDAEPGASPLMRMAEQRGGAQRRAHHQAAQHEAGEAPVGQAHAQVVIQIGDPGAAGIGAGEGRQRLGRRPRMRRHGGQPGFRKRRQKRRGEQGDDDAGQRQPARAPACHRQQQQPQQRVVAQDVAPPQQPGMRQADQQQQQQPAAVAPGRVCARTHLHGETDAEQQREQGRGLGVQQRGHQPLRDAVLDRGGVQQELMQGEIAQIGQQYAQQREAAQRVQQVQPGRGRRACRLHGPISVLAAILKPGAAMDGILAARQPSVWGFE